MTSPTCPLSRRIFLVAAVALSLLGSTRIFAQAVAPAKPLTAEEELRAKAAAEGVSQLSTFTVTEQQDIGYESMQTTSGMRTVQELKNLANSISIINAQLIQDTASITI